MHKISKTKSKLSQLLLHRMQYYNMLEYHLHISTAVRLCC